MEKYRGALNFNQGDVMEEVPLDYSTLDQTTKRKLAQEKAIADTMAEGVERNIALAEATENKRAERIADLISEFSSNDKGETLANVHTSQGFQEVYDYRGTYLERYSLERRMEQAQNMQTQLFQKVYYAKGLLLEDERTLRSAFSSAKDTYDSTLTAA